ncbi:MAG: arylesterase [Nevskiales bacterium]
MLKHLLLILVLLPLPAFAATQPTRQPTILVTGDSLSAAYGMALDQGWVALLQKRLREQGYPHAVVNTSVSGETTRGALARLPAELARHKPAIVLIELGGNDGLRGQPVKTLRGNLAKMVALSRQAGAKPVLFEMRLPANYGPQYTEDFRKSFGAVASAEKVPLVPFMLESIALDPKSFQNDGIHPTATVQPKLLDTVWPTLKPLLDQPTGKAARGG